MIFGSSSQWFRWPHVRQKYFAQKSVTPVVARLCPYPKRHYVNLDRNARTVEGINTNTERSLRFRPERYRTKGENNRMAFRLSWAVPHLSPPSARNVWDQMHPFYRTVEDRTVEDSTVKAWLSTSSSPPSLCPSLSATHSALATTTNELAGNGETVAPRRQFPLTLRV